MDVLVFILAMIGLGVALSVAMVLYIKFLFWFVEKVLKL